MYRLQYVCVSVCVIEIDSSVRNANFHENEARFGKDKKNIEGR